MTDYKSIAGRIKSEAFDGVSVEAQEVLDISKNKKQSQINAETDTTLANHASAIQGLNSQNYKTYTATDQTTAETDVLPAEGSEDTIYRLGNWDGTQYDVTCYSEYSWNGSAYVHICTKSQIDEVFDISAYHASGGTLAEYADLAAALDSNNGGGVPQSLQKGGMSVKFVQSSDNKYIQARCMAQNFTTDVTQWAIADEGVYVDNPEFVYVKTDKEGKILWAIKIDGSIYYGAGVPQQVIDYIEEKIADLSLDEYEDIVAFLNDLEKGDKTLQDLLNEKVDKEEGKSLIDADYASTKSTIDNPEFLEMTLDAEDKVLEGIQKDGTKVIGGDLKVGGNATIDGDTKILGNMEVSGVSYKVIENPEYLVAWVDAEYKVVFGFKTDGKTYIGDADFLNDIDDIKAFLQNITDKNIDWDALSSITAVENPEFIEAKTDSEGKLLAGRTTNGAAFEKVGFTTPKISIDGATIENIEDPEGRTEIENDAEGKIISYRDNEGVKHENVGIETGSATIGSATINSLNLTSEGMTEFQQALKDAGFKPSGAGNFSDAKTVELPEPKKYGMLNLIIPALPIDDTPVEGYAEYYDFAGNYFKKACEISPQGQTSKIFALTGGKGNYTLDITDNSEIKFGSWVPQDSFHLKGGAKDITIGFLATSYKFAWKIMNYLNVIPNRVLMNENNITTRNATGERITDWPTDARCISDGFPCELYVNGEYWGLYSWQLKKHRKNYSMDKKDYTSFFIDADNLMPGGYQQGFWLGNIPWTQFEIKNPKDLVCMDGSAYDGDHPRELIDSTSSSYDSSNKKHRGSAQTKAIIQSFSTKYLEVKALVDTNTPESLAEAKTKFAEYFDVDACIFVYIFNCTMYNRDSIDKNTLWGTYGDGKIVPMLWDLDGMYGTTWSGTTVRTPSASLWEGDYATAQWPMRLLWTLYRTEINNIYANLRTNNIISIDTWENIIFEQWVKRIGTEAYERDIKKWPESPSYRENYTNVEYWQEVGWVGSSSTSPLWDENTNYNVGDSVVMKMHPNYSHLYKYNCIKNNVNVCPVTKFYNSFPQVGGYYESPKRMKKWMLEQIQLCDTLLNYNQN